MGTSNMARRYSELMRNAECRPAITPKIQVWVSRSVIAVAEARATLVWSDWERGRLLRMGGREIGSSFMKSTHRWGRLHGTYSRTFGIRGRAYRLSKATHGGRSRTRRLRDSTCWRWTPFQGMRFRCT